MLGGTGDARIGHTLKSCYGPVVRIFHKLFLRATVSIKLGEGRLVVLVLYRESLGRSVLFLFHFSLASFYKLLSDLLTSLACGSR